MSEPAKDTLVRPRQVTMAGWMIILASVAVVLTVFQQLSTLHSLEMTRTLERSLSEPPVRELGIGVEGARSFLRIFAMVAAACATAAAILGWQVLQRSRSARVALAVLALPLFVTGITSGGLLSSVVVAAALMLWLQPARDWFDGRKPVAAVVAAPVAPLAQPGPGAQPHSQQHGVPAVPGVARPRPPQVVAACVLTWIGSGLALLFAVLFAVGLVVDRSLVDDVLADNPDAAGQGVTRGMVLGFSIAMMAVFAAWCAVAMVVAGLLWRGVRWSYPLLTISAAVASLICVVALLASTVMLLPLVLCAATVALLVRPETRAWARPDIS